MRKFTPTVQQVANLLEQDIGRPLSHISDNMLDIDLSAEARQVLRLRKKVTLQTRTKAGGAYTLEISPYISVTASSSHARKQGVQAVDYKVAPLKISSKLFSMLS